MWIRGGFYGGKRAREDCGPAQVCGLQSSAALERDGVRRRYVVHIARIMCCRWRRSAGRMAAVFDSEKKAWPLTVMAMQARGVPRLRTCARSKCSCWARHGSGKACPCRRRSTARACWSSPSQRCGGLRSEVELAPVNTPGRTADPRDPVLPVPAVRSERGAGMNTVTDAWYHALCPTWVRALLKSRCSEPKC
jgi:hypothetical protein